MKLLGTVLLFGGYCLVYAAVAHGGVFATDPWSGIFADAYTDVGGSSGQTSSASNNPPSNTASTSVRPRTTIPVGTSGLGRRN